MFHWQDILDFWFGDLSPDGLPDTYHRQRWFTADRGFDREIRRRFLSSLLLIAEDGMPEWLGSPGGMLASIIVLDQFSRNIHRGTAMAFEYDTKARQLCRQGLARGLDIVLPAVQRAFFYMPFQHSERLADQEEGVALFEQLAATYRDTEKALLDGFAASAREHAELIRRFGRFPHRNRVLKRANTEGEERYLSEKPKSFGQ